MTFGNLRASGQLRLEISTKALILSDACFHVCFAVFEIQNRHESFIRSAFVII